MQHNQKRILITPLDWGLGHTTRCIPIIYELLLQGALVLIAGNMIQINLLRKEFPQCKFLILEGYNIKYASKKNRFLFRMLLQIPRMLQLIRKEHNWLKTAVREHAIDGIISDNRYGMHHYTVPTVFITHQLLIKNPLGKKLEQQTQRINYSYINRFSECWVPDVKTYPGLAGDLSHPSRFPETTTQYIGPLSRMVPISLKNKSNVVAIILSGPEPQRSILEDLIYKQLPEFKDTVVFVRGLPNETQSTLSPLAHVTIFNHLVATDLNHLLCRAKFVICRSGYSSVMDICAIKAPSILIPTPGQTEQEYLAELLMKQGIALSIPQHNFSLSASINQAQHFPYSFPELSADSLKEAIAGFLKKCGKIS